MATLQPGEKIGPYTVLKRLGRGGMSDVYQAQDELHHREVTLKFPHPDMMGDPATYERFSREVKIGKLLEHPHIQKLYELAGDTREPYLVLEYVPGHTLRDWLREQKANRDAPPPPERALNIGLQVGHALMYAHEKHVFHRDLKPENIIMTPDGEAKVMDFGIAFLRGARRITWGPLSSQIGTPDYMAPEQIKGVRGDQRTDIYALGMILYECAAGRLPYDGDNALAVMNQHVNVSPPPIHQFYRDISPALEEVILKAIRRNPAGRWPSMQAFTLALQHPETVDVEALKAERAKEENARAPRSGGGVDNDFGRPLWQVALIVGGTLLALVGLGVLAQILHHGP